MKKLKSPQIGIQHVYSSQMNCLHLMKVVLKMKFGKISAGLLLLVGLPKRLVKQKERLLLIESDVGVSKVLKRKMVGLPYRMAGLHYRRGTLIYLVLTVADVIKKDFVIHLIGLC